MNWLIPNLPRIATWIMIGLAVLVALMLPTLVSTLPRIFARAELNVWTFVASLGVFVVAAIYVLCALFVYGLVLRLLAFFDDVAAIRRACAKSATPLD